MYQETAYCEGPYNPEMSLQEKCIHFWNCQRARYQTGLIEHLINEQVVDFEYEDIENYNEPEDFDPEDDERNFHNDPEWFLINDYLLSYLREHGETVLENSCGIWWGRRANGHPVYEDDVIRRIVLQIEERLENRRKWRSV